MRKKVIRLNAITNAQLIKYLLEGIYTNQELSEITGLCVRTIRTYVSAMHKAGALHISSWKKDSIGHYSMCVYKIGEGKDAKKPKMTDSEIRKRYRQKLKARKNHTSPIRTQFVGGSLWATQ